MTETTGSSTLPPPILQKANPWLIIIVVCVVLCCFCVGAIGLLLAFGERISNELGIIH